MRDADRFASQNQGSHFGIQVREALCVWEQNPLVLLGAPVLLAKVEVSEGGRPKKLKKRWICKKTLYLLFCYYKENELDEGSRRMVWISRITR